MDSETTCTCMNIMTMPEAAVGLKHAHSFTLDRIITQRECCLLLNLYKYCIFMNILSWLLTHDASDVNGQNANASQCLYNTFYSIHTSLTPKRQL